MASAAMSPEAAVGVHGGSVSRRRAAWALRDGGEISPHPSLAQAQGPLQLGRCLASGVSVNIGTRVRKTPPVSDCSLPCLFSA